MLNNFAKRVSPGRLYHEILTLAMKPGKVYAVSQ